MIEQVEKVYIPLFSREHEGVRVRVKKRIYLVRDYVATIVDGTIPERCFSWIPHPKAILRFVPSTLKPVYNDCCLKILQLDKLHRGLPFQAPACRGRERGEGAKTVHSVHLPLPAGDLFFSSLGGLRGGTFIWRPQVRSGTKEPGGGTFVWRPQVRSGTKEPG